MHSTDGIKKVISGFAKCFVLFSSSHDAASSMDGYNDLVLRLGDEPGVSLFFADSPQACLPMAMSIAQNHPGRNSLLTGRAPVTEVINWQHCPDKVVFNMLASIPGIGTHSAFALAEAFGSLKHISSASMAEILDKTDLSGSQAAQVVRIFKGSAPAPLDGPFAWPVDGSVDGPVRGAVDD